MSPKSFKHFQHVTRPGKELFYILSSAYASAMTEVPAQIFCGEWTGSSKGADLAVYDIAAQSWQNLPFDGNMNTSHLFVDPDAPRVFMSGMDNVLYEIDRRDLSITRKVDMPRKYTADFDGKGKIWFAMTRSLTCYDIDSGTFEDFENVSPDDYYYAEGTHMVLGMGKDGRVWTNQGPFPCVCVFDPETKESKVVWASKDMKSNPPGGATPVSIGKYLWVGQLFIDQDSDEIVEAPFNISQSADDDGFRPLLRGTWHRTPTAQLDRDGRALVRRSNDVGWLDVNNGEFEEIGRLPEDFSPILVDCSLHEDRFFISADKTHIDVIDLHTQENRPVSLDFKPHHAQTIYEWWVSENAQIFGNGYSHDLWQTDAEGNFKTHGDVVNIRSGEIWGYRDWKEKLFIISYTGSSLTRLDMSRKSGDWGLEAGHNPRGIIDLVAHCTGQHRPRGIDITPDGKLYYISCSDYCDRREGALVIVDAESEEVLHIEDPLLPGEQLWSIAASRVLPEVYIGTSEGSFIVWDCENQKVKDVFTFPPLDERAGEMTSANIKIGGIRFLGVAGARVIGNRFSYWDTFHYDASKGEMQAPAFTEQGKVFAIASRCKKDTALTMINGSMYEYDQNGEFKLLYDAPLPIGDIREDGNGRIYLSDDKMDIYAEEAR